MPAVPNHRPVVLVPACNRTLGEHPFHIAGHKYVDAVRLAGALPLMVPGLAEDDAEALLDLADGVLLTGSPSNVHPSHFGEAVLDPRLPLDPARDAWVLPFVRRVLARGLPLLAICRGTQETNVALGGSLHQAVHAVPGLADHRADDALPAARQYAPAHRVKVYPGGVLEKLLGDLREFEVNSLHGQGVAIPAPGLRIEAVAPDGVVEAFSVPDAPGFNLCLQWHPEWQAAHNPVSMRLLQGFGAAARQYRDRVRGPLPAAAAST
ncbi:gamma-Glu-GABA hydrolase [Rubrivivax sp. A210]|uniref:gamma-glutamyl-gamma-aminobutyrate hydrolase family protein n=1 Tax=Rubrivivax sp. A210 TaxID=2772301 RepID=UPI00191B53B9|nr:gamma-glutamyl-gamma-aminobutyrate hydrolase family protein [Rubrivivax sp. A210]CAD5366116.1 gamma-Glu-GABA hydrolase [Rubrivivax sp. A210]